PSPICASGSTRPDAVIPTRALTGHDRIARPTERANSSMKSLITVIVEPERSIRPVRDGAPAPPRGRDDLQKAVIATLPDVRYRSLRHCTPFRRSALPPESGHYQWVVLIAGSTGSALRTVRPSQPRQTSPVHFRC